MKKIHVDKLKNIKCSCTVSKWNYLLKNVCGDQILTTDCIKHNNDIRRIVLFIISRTSLADKYESSSKSLSRKKIVINWI